MNGTSPYNSDSEKDKLDLLLEELSGTYMDSEVRRQDTESVDPEDITITNTEIEQALSAVKSRLGSEYADTRESKQGPHNYRLSIPQNYLFYLAAAAVILLVAGFGYLRWPVINSVPYAEIATVQLPDGSSVVMNSGTEIQYNRLFGITNRHIHFNGEAYFKVRPADHRFIVEANGAIVEVTGTEFNVRSWSGRNVYPIEVSVASGTVNLYPSADNSRVVTVESGLSSSWRQGQREPTDPEKVNISEVVSWKENKLSFVGQPLNLICDELERKFDTKIEIEDEGIGKEILTTYYSNTENVETILQDIVTVKGLNYRETSNGYIIFKKDSNS